MDSIGTLFLVCGKMGAGKSTLTRQLAKTHQAVLLSEDDWLAAHYPAAIQTFDDYRHYAAQIAPFVKAHVQQILLSGCNVVMDFPANTVKQRQWLFSIGTEADAEMHLTYLETTDALCLARLSTRRLEQPERAQFDRPEVFHHVSQFFQAPTADECRNLTLQTVSQG